MAVRMDFILDSFFEISFWVPSGKTGPVAKLGQASWWGSGWLREACLGHQSAGWPANGLKIGSRDLDFGKIGDQGNAGGCSGAGSATAGGHGHGLGWIGAAAIREVVVRMGSGG